MKRVRLGLCAIAVATLAACASTGDTVISGRFGPDEPVTLENLTIASGEYVISYTILVFMAPEGAPIDVVCGVVDTSGTINFFSGLVQTVKSGHWARLEAQSKLDLPDLTLGLRCYPERDSSLEVIVRTADLVAIRLD